MMIWNQLQHFLYTDYYFHRNNMDGYDFQTIFLNR